jgi:hypothetical protein
MSEFEKKKLEMDLRKFAASNFESPGDCRNVHQIKFYIRELCDKIEECEGRFNFVPGWAYVLLAQYNNEYNSIMHAEFRKAYC